MQNSSLRHEEDFTDDTFDDDLDPSHSHHLNNASSDVKLRRNQNDSSTYPILHRALSTVSANQTLANNQRNVLAKNFRRTSINDEIVTIDHNDADASFLLPNLFELPEEIRPRVMESLVDTPTMVSLEETKRLNWWANKKLPCPKLYPLLTSGDGNCLLHATSLAMWGFHDHSLSMRKALNETLITSKPNNALYRRWRWTQSVQNKKYGLVFSEQEWNEEWKSLLRLSSAEPRISQTKSSNSADQIASMDEMNPSKSSATVNSTNTGGSTKSSAQSTRQYYESLEEFHVYVLANNIRRPIIVYSDTILRTNDGEAISPIEFGGIYLPLEIPPDKCHKQPVFLAFDAAHFSALVPMEQNSKSNVKVTYRIPLIDIETLELLPIHFVIDPGLDFQWPIDEELSDEKMRQYNISEENRLEILEKYLNLSKEMVPFQTFQSPSMHPEESVVPIENPPSTSIPLESVNENNAAVPPPPPPPAPPTTTTKKTSRPSFNSFSKIIRRTFIQPFSSAKRMSLKRQQQSQSPSQQQSLQEHPAQPLAPNSNDTLDAPLLHENLSERRKSSPLLNRRTNILTIIVTNFQPKRPKTSDNMIKNYIDACLKDYQLERMKKDLNEMAAVEDEHLNLTKPLNSVNGNNSSKSQFHYYSDWNDNSSVYPSSTNNYRYHHPSSSSVVGHYRQENLSTNNFGSNSNEVITNRRQLPPIPTHPNTSNRNIRLARHGQKSFDIDDNEDLLPIDHGPFSTNITYVQPSQRKGNHMIQSNSLEMTPEYYVYGNSHSSNRSSHKPIPLSLKRQQSTSSDQNSHNNAYYESRATDMPLNVYTSTSSNINKRTQQMTSLANGTSRPHHF